MLLKDLWPLWQGPNGGCGNDLFFVMLIESNRILLKVVKFSMPPVAPVGKSQIAQQARSKLTQIDSNRQMIFLQGRDILV